MTFPFARRCIPAVHALLVMGTVLMAIAAPARAGIEVTTTQEIPLHDHEDPVTVRFAYSWFLHGAVAVSVLSARSPDGVGLPAAAVQSPAACTVADGIGSCVLKFAPGYIKKPGAYPIDLKLTATGWWTSEAEATVKAVLSLPRVRMSATPGKSVEIPIPWLRLTQPTAKLTLTIQEFTGKRSLKDLSVVPSPPQGITITPKAVPKADDQSTAVFEVLIEHGDTPGRRTVTFQPSLADAVLDDTLAIDVQDTRQFPWKLMVVCGALTGLSCVLALRRRPWRYDRKLRRRISGLRSEITKSTRLPGKPDGAHVRANLLESLDRAAEFLNACDTMKSVAVFDETERAYYVAIADHATSLTAECQALENGISGGTDAEAASPGSDVRRRLETIRNHLFDGELAEAARQLADLRSGVPEPKRSEPAIVIEVTAKRELRTGMHAIFTLVRPRSGTHPGPADWSYSDGRRLSEPTGRDVRSFRDCGLFAVRAQLPDAADAIVHHVGVAPVREQVLVMRHRIRVALWMGLAYMFLTIASMSLFWFVEWPFGGEATALVIAFLAALPWGASWLLKKFYFKRNGRSWT